MVCCVDNSSPATDDLVVLLSAGRESGYGIPYSADEIFTYGGDCIEAFSVEPA